MYAKIEECFYYTVLPILHNMVTELIGHKIQLATVC